MIDPYSDSDFDSWLVATTPGDSDSDPDSDSAPLLITNQHIDGRLVGRSVGASSDFLEIFRKIDYFGTLYGRS